MTPSWRPVRTSGSHATPAMRHSSRRLACAQRRLRDPVGLLLGQAASRELVSVRHGRMLVSPFTFYQGAALPMAADLASTPASGLRVQRGTRSLTSWSMTDRGG
jgi:hypothetical protein